MAARYASTDLCSDNCLDALWCDTERSSTTIVRYNSTIVRDRTFRFGQIREGHSLLLGLT